MAQELRVHQNNTEQNNQASPQLQRARAMPVLSPFDEFDRLFDELLPTSMFRLGAGPLTRGMMDAQARGPRVDLLERDDSIVLRAEVPGIRKEDLEISVDESSVTLRGSFTREQKDEQGAYFRREISRGEFVRSIALPSLVDTAKAQASLDEGLLELVMPKLEAAKRRKVQIK